MEELKETLADLQNGVEEKVGTFVDWVRCNKEVLVVVLPVITPIVKGTFKFLSKQISLRKQKNFKELYCYDRSLGHYWVLRRELTNQEWIAIEERRARGERLASILADMQVLK